MTYDNNNLQVTGHQGGSSNTHNKAGTCARCKSRKVKCEWLEEAQACCACVKGGAQGTCAPSRQEKMSTRRSARSSSCEPSSMVPHPLPTNPVISKLRNVKRRSEDQNMVSHKPAKTQKHARSASMPVSDSYSSSTVPGTGSSELVAIPELDEESNDLERPKSTILADGTPLPLSTSYKRVVNFLEWCNDDDMEEVEAGERKGKDHHDHDVTMDIGSDSDADDSELDSDNSESDGMSIRNAQKVPQRGRPKKAVHVSGSKRFGSQLQDSQPPEPDPETCGKL